MIELVIEKPTITTVKPQCGGPDDQIIFGKQSLSSIVTKIHAGYFRISLSLQPSLAMENNGGANRRRTCFTTCLFHFEMVKAEFLHRVGVNYLFAPWISWLLLLQSSPFFTPNTVCYQVLWWVFVTPVIVLDVKIYGQWFTKGKRFLSTVANPTSQLSVIGNLVASRAAAQMGWKESAVCMFSLGMAHYLVLFVTLYQRLSGSNSLPAMLRPVFFLFIGAPSMASLAWDSICGKFDYTSKMLFYLSLFLFISLVSRPTLFKKSMKKFDVAWWAYSFPLTVLALASIEYAQEVKGGLAHTMMLGLSAISVLVSLFLLVVTALNSNMLLPPADPPSPTTSSCDSMG
ncbi:hypothetical protein FNV43_RR13276 [Rhamnella rubrinervis]|uniref:Uncharacterized protein n=1 Tax=Rhamnella rubrinervis TaxID=2594499 RepID=A0A8K0MF45_9ROSA|nr:hypothetical protein FNV43_RR13276 [Rhamnella rubrinervis]